MDLKPDKYYARIVIDTNGNGVWDTGNYIEKRQPEEVYYSPNDTRSCRTGRSKRHGMSTPPAGQAKAS